MKNKAKTAEKYVREFRGIDMSKPTTQHMDKLKEEFEKRFKYLDETDMQQLWQFISSTIKKERKEILDQIEPRLYALHANIDFVYNSSARRQAKELLDLVDKLK